MVDERTPLLLQPKPIAPPSLLPFPTTTKRTSSSSPTCSTLRSTRLDDESTTIPRDVDGDDVNLSFSKLLKIFASLQTGHLPSTVQFINLTNYFLNNSQWLAPQAQDSYVLGVRVGQLSVKGEKVKTSMREFIESLRELIKMRNPDISASNRKGKEREVTTGGDGWQEFIYRLKQSTGSRKSTPPSSSSNIAPPLEEEEDEENSPMISSILTLITLFFTSIEIRQLIIDSIVLLRDVARLTLTKEREEEEGERVPQEVGKVIDFVAREGIGKVAIDREMKEENEKKVGRRRGIDSSIEEEGIPDPPLVDDAKQIEEESEPILPPNESAEELRDRFIDRFKDILMRLQSTPQYQSAMSNLLKIFRNYLERTVSISQPSFSTTTTLKEEEEPINDFAIPLLEPFTGSLSRLIDSFNSLISHFSRSNPNSTPHHSIEMIKNVDQFLTKVLLQPKYLYSNQANKTLENLYTEFSSLGENNPDFSKDFQSFLKEIVKVIETVSRDEYLKRFYDATIQLLASLEDWVTVAGIKSARVVTSGGPGGLFGEFGGDILDWFLPRILGILNEIPIPRIEFSSNRLDGALEFPSLLSTSIVPAEFTIRNSTSLTYLPTLGKSHQDIPPSTSTTTTTTTTTTPTRSNNLLERTCFATHTNLDLKGIEFEILNVGYFFKWKTHLPSFFCFPSHITESGLLDLHFGSTDTNEPIPGIKGGGGFSFSLDSTSLDEQSSSSLFTIEDSTKVSLENFNIRFHETKHPLINWFLRPVLKPLIKKAIEVEMRKALMRQGDKLGKWAFKFKENKKEEDYKFETKGSENQVWNWIKAFWKTVSEEEKEEENERQVEEQTATTTSTNVHLNRHGITIHSIEDETPSNSAIVGIGVEGVVIPEGEASIPLPPGQDERIGIVNRAKREVDQAVESGRKVARNTWDVVGGIGEASEEWRDDLEGERKKFERRGWRSDAFDLRR